MQFQCNYNSTLQSHSPCSIASTFCFWSALLCLMWILNCCYYSILPWHCTASMNLTSESMTTQCTRTILLSMIVNSACYSHRLSGFFRLGAQHQQLWWRGTAARVSAPAPLPQPSEAPASRTRYVPYFSYRLVLYLLLVFGERDWCAWCCRLRCL